MRTPQLDPRRLQPAAMTAPAAPPRRLSPVAAPPRKLSPPAGPPRRLSPPAGPPRKLSPPAERSPPVNKSPPHRLTHPHPPPHRRPPTPTLQRSHLHGQQHKHQTSAWSVGFLSAWLTQRTPVLGLRGWVLVAAAGAAVVLAVLVLTVCLCRRRRRRRRCPRVAPSLHHGGASRSMKHHLHQAMADKEIVEEEPVRWHPPPPCGPPFQPPIEVIKAEQKAPLITVESARSSGETATSIAGSARGWSTESGASDSEADASQRGWGRRYTRRELEEATDGFAAQNVLGEGGYGVVYKGVLRDSTLVAIKNLHNNRGQAEKDFRVEVATIGRVRHKNLVSLLGYCSEGACRMLVYEYMENSNLDKWLHHEEGEISQLNWDTRMHILLGTAKGLAYLHEGLEPKIVHRDVKSSNILLDGQWNARVSDFGLAKLLCSEASYVTTRVMGTFGSASAKFPCHRRMEFVCMTFVASRCLQVRRAGVRADRDAEREERRVQLRRARHGDDHRQNSGGLHQADRGGELGGVAEAHGSGEEGGGGAGPDAAGGAAVQGAEARRPRRAPVRRPRRRAAAHHGPRGAHARGRSQVQRRTPACAGSVGARVGVGVGVVGELRARGVNNAMDMDGRTDGRTDGCVSLAFAHRMFLYDKLVDRTSFLLRLRLFA